MAEYVVSSGIGWNAVVLETRIRPHLQMVAPCPLDHAGQERAGQDGGGDHVQLDRRQFGFRIVVENFGEASGAGVVDQQVDLALDRLVDHPGPAFRRGQVGGHGFHRTAWALQFGLALGQFFFVARDQQQVGRLRQRFGKGGADAGRAAGDQGEAVRHPFSSFSSG